MNRLRFLMLAAVCLVVPAGTVCSAPVPAARSGLEQVPATAPIVIHIRGIKGAHDRLVKLMNKALPDVFNKYKSQIDDFFEKGPDGALKGRKLLGLKDDGPHFMVYTDLPKMNDPGIPKIAILLAVSDYKKFRENFLNEEERKNAKEEGNGIESASLENTQTYFVNRKSYIVITPDKDVAESFTSSKKITGLDTKLKDQAGKLLTSDLGIYVNMEAVNKEYGEQIKQSRQGLEQLISLVAAGGDETQKQGAEMVKNFLPHIFQTIEDTQTLMATFEFRPGGLGVHLHTGMMEGSTTANLLQDSRPVAFKELERLPNDRAIYVGAKPSSGLFKILSGLIAGLPGGESKDLSNLMGELVKAGPESMFLGTSLPINGLIAYHYTDPAKAVAAQVKLLKAAIARDSDPQHSGLKEKPKLKTDAQKHGDFKLHSVELVWDFDKLTEPLTAKLGDDAKKQLIESVKGILGEKMTVWFGTDGKSAVQIAAADWEAARKLLDEYSKGGGVAPDVKELRKEMPARTSLLGMIDAVQLLKTGVDLVKPFGAPLPPDWPNMAAKGAMTYIGLAVTLQPNRGGIDLFIPNDAFKEFYGVVIKPLVGE